MFFYPATVHFQSCTLNVNKIDVVLCFRKLICAFSLTCFKVHTCTISDKSYTFSLNYSNLCRGPLFFGTQCTSVESGLQKNSIGSSRLSVRDNTSRTNNAVESFGAVLRRRIKIPHPNLFAFLGLLERTTEDISRRHCMTQPRPGQSSRQEKNQHREPFTELAHYTLFIHYVRQIGRIVEQQRMK